MRQSNIFIPTTKEVPSDAVVTSHQLLLKGGYVKQTAAGIYSYLPLGNIILENIIRVIDEEFMKIGSNKILMPALQPKELWDKSSRWEAYGDELMRLTDRHGREFALGPTHEEVVTDLFSNYLNSYKKLPLNVYQIQTKFRDEKRPRFGLIRGREFLMLDAYSFSKDENDLDQQYKNYEEAYENVFNRLNLKFKGVIAEAGPIGGSDSKEYMAISEIGEDTIIFKEEEKDAYNIEVFEAQNKEITNDYKTAKGIEIGHIFKIGTKYTEAFKTKYLDQNQKEQIVYMGCYGIGVSRLMSALIEQHNIDNEIIWPTSIAPFDIHIIVMDYNKKEDQKNLAEELYTKYTELGLKVLLDDRNERPGVKFGDSELIGISKKFIIGRNASQGIVEYKDRLNDINEEINLEELNKKIKG